jgi:hypothetical protein
MHNWKQLPETNHALIQRISNGKVEMIIEDCPTLVVEDAPGLYCLLQFVTDDELPKYARISVDSNGKFSVKM